MRKLIRTDGTEQDLPHAMSTRELCELIDAETLDTVSLHHMGSPLHVMVVDDRGYETEMIDRGDGRYVMQPMRALKPINKKATELYLANCKPGTAHEIVGDVVVVPDDDYADHGEGA